MGAWALFGRDAELADLAGACTDGPKVALISGAAGIGKTRLAQEVSARLESKGFHVEWLRASASTQSIPFGSCMSLLSDLALPAANDALFVLRRAAAALSSRAGDKPLLVVVDDAHCLDDASAALLHQLAVPATEAAPATVLLTARTGRPIPQAVAALCKDTAARRLELAPLDRDASMRMAATMLDGQLDPASADRLYRVAAGNPLHVREVVLAGAFLTTADGVWRWTGEVPVASRLVELLALRLNRLGAAERDALDVLALGDPLPVAIAEHLVPIETLIALQNDDLIDEDRVDGQAVLRLTHPLYGELLRTMQGTIARRAGSQRLADAIAAQGPTTRIDAVRLALWRLDAGMTGTPAELVTAAKVAYSLCEWELAGRLAAAAPGGRGGPEATLIMAQAHRRCARYQEGADALARWAAIDDPALRAAAAAELAAIEHFGFDNTARAEATIRQALQRADGNDERDTLIEALASILSTAGKVVEAAALALPLARDPHAAPARRVAAVVPACTGLTMTGRSHEALALCGELAGVALASPEEQAYGLALILAQRIFATLLSGDLDGAEQLTLAARQLALAENDEQVHGTASLVLGQVNLSRGKLVDARGVLHAGIASLRRFDPQAGLPMALALLAQVEGHAGAAPASARLAAEAEAQLRAASGLYRSEVVLARAWAAAASGDETVAWTTALDAATMSTDLGQPMLATYQFHEAFRLGCPAAVVHDRLEVAARQCDGIFQHIALAHVGAVAAGDQEAVDDAAYRLEDLGMIPAAAEAWLDAADAHRARNETRPAALAVARCVYLAGKCQGDDRPRLKRAGVAERRQALSSRELEVTLRFGGEGSVDAVAEALDLDRRTVEGHLRRALLKLS